MYAINAVNYYYEIHQFNTNHTCVNSIMNIAYLGLVRTQWAQQSSSVYHSFSIYCKFTVIYSTSISNHLSFQQDTFLASLSRDTGSIFLGNSKTNYFWRKDVVAPIDQFHTYKQKGFCKPLRIRRYSQIFANIRRYSQIFTDIRIYSQIFADIRRFSQIFAIFCDSALPGTVLSQFLSLVTLQIEYFS